jgi:single-stranded DNA-binding protein
MNVVEISGKLTREPELRHVGVKEFPILSLNVAVDNAFGRFNPETKKTEVESGFYQVEVKGDYALAFKNLSRGDAIYVKGSLSQWTMKPKEGETHGETKTRIAADLLVPLTGSSNQDVMGSPSMASAGSAPQVSTWDEGWPAKPGGF